MIQIPLPWPAGPLHPNFRSRSHWPKTRALKKARADANIATRAFSYGRADTRLGAGPLKIVTAFYPPTAHVRDGDNLLASCKAYFDGIAEALGVDDSRFEHQAPILGEPVKGGNVIVVILETETPSGEEA